MLLEKSVALFMLISTLLIGFAFSGFKWCILLVLKVTAFQNTSSLAVCFSLIGVLCVRFSLQQDYTMSAVWSPDGMSQYAAYFISDIHRHTPLDSDMHTEAHITDIAAHCINFTWELSWFVRCHCAWCVCQNKEAVWMQWTWRKMACSFFLNHLAFLNFPFSQICRHHVYESKQLEEMILCLKNGRMMVIEMKLSRISQIFWVFRYHQYQSQEHL